MSFGAVPVPGATVTLTQGAKTFAALSDGQGFYYFADMPDGDWTLSVRMFGFAPLEQAVKVQSGAAATPAELQMLSLVAMLAEAKTIAPVPLPAALQARAAQPESHAAGKDEEKPTEELNLEAQHRAEDASDGLVINGSQSNAATSKYTLNAAFGNRRPGSKALYNGSLAIYEGNAALDARPYSITGLPVPKDPYNRFTGVAYLGGPLRIPHLLPHGPTFSLAYEWTHDSDQNTISALVPTVAERGGDLSGLVNAQGQPLTILNPATGAPFTGPVPVSPQAQALLRLYPLPNIAGNTRYNFQVPLLYTNHADAMQARLNKSIGRRDHFYGGLSFQSARSNSTNLFDFLDTTNTLGINANAHWSHLLHHQFLADTGFLFSRFRSEIRPAFQGVQNVSGAAGVNGNDQEPADWGPPTLAFASGVASLYDGVRTFNRTRTDGVAESVSWTHGVHNVTLGGDFRRAEFNYVSQQNPRGTFTFTGAATAGTANTSNTATQTTGSDLADFLLGVPDTSAIAYGNADKYLRQSVYDLFATDDWRIRPELTINAGMRWEYGVPLTELYGRLVNLDVTGGFAAVAPVLGSSPRGTLTGDVYPTSLLQPDRRGFEPRVGVSWRPVPASTLVIRAGYGIYDDTSIYLSSALQMAQQAPLSRSLSMANSAACPLTLANGFPSCGTTAFDPFGVDPNLRVGYAQTWQLSAQRDLPGALVVIASYLGVKGTHGEQEFLPNTYPLGAVGAAAGGSEAASPSGFVYRTSGGNSTRQAGTLQVRRRLRSGLTATAEYTFSKSIDDDATVGAQGHVTTSAAGETPASTATPTIAQNWLNLRAERSPSTFDQRHLLTLNLQYSSGVGLHGGTLFGGWRGRVVKDWTISNDFKVGSGLPETPVYLAAVPGTGITGTIRPNRTGVPLYNATTGTAGYVLNAAAYSAPTAGAWGTAGRDSIAGPQQLTLNTSLARTIRLREPFNFDIRFDATNVLNHVVYMAWNTTVNSTTFGLPTFANSMRMLQTNLRVRF